MTCGWSASGGEGVVDLVQGAAAERLDATGASPIRREVDLDALVIAAPTTAHLDLAPEAAGLLAVSLGFSRMYRDDLEQLATSDHADILALQGWRRTLFGEAALKLKRGELALVLDDNRVRVVAVRRAPKG